jgi:peptidoglycan hydrolase-like protein with peptidoglycan-binding domain
VAFVSQFRSTAKPGRKSGSAGKAGQPRRFRRAILTALAALGVPVIVFAALGVIILTAKPSLAVDNVALARVNLPFGSGTVQSISVVGGREQKTIPVAIRDGKIWPQQQIPVHERVTLIAVVKRPGWLSWLDGKTQRIRLALTTPSARLRSQYLTLKSGAPLRVAFRTPISKLAYGMPGSIKQDQLSSPARAVDVPHTGEAGLVYVAAAPRTWERAKLSVVSWFPSGTAATAVANPSPGTTITPHTKITLSFSKPVAKALDGQLPPVTPAGSGSWATVNSHEIEFVPQGYGYGLGANVTVALPAGVRLVDGTASGGDAAGKWTVPGGSTMRLQQMLAMLGYLPFKFSYAGKGVASNPIAEEQAAVDPPAGTFNWRYSNVPSQLRAMWKPGTAGVMTQGAIMAFENNEGMTTDGVAGPSVWKALINATIAGKASTFGYTFVSVSEGSPESEDTWHNGKTVVSGAVNTGIPAAPTETGTYPVFEHVPVTTMTGVNPDGSKYSDPGIQWVSYFHGGDALHEFPRGSYGFPQSLGCVEMPDSEAAAVYPYTPIGTLVDVS